MDESFVERYTLDNVSHKGKTRGSLDSRALPEEIKKRTMDNVDQAGSRHQGESLEDDLLITRIDSDEAARSTLVEP